MHLEAFQPHFTQEICTNNLIVINISIAFILVKYQPRQKITGQVGGILALDTKIKLNLFSDKTATHINKTL